VATQSPAADGNPAKLPCGDKTECREPAASVPFSLLDVSSIPLTSPGAHGIQRGDVDRAGIFDTAGFPRRTPLDAWATLGYRRLGNRGSPAANQDGITCQRMEREGQAT